MPRFWSITLALLLAGCGGPPPLQTGMQPPMYPPGGMMPDGMMDPGMAGGLDPSLMMPLSGGMGGGGLGGGLLGDAGGGFGGGAMGGGLLGGGGGFGISNAMGGSSLFNAPPPSLMAGTDGAMDSAVPPTAAPAETGDRQVESHRPGHDGGHGPLLISSRMRTDPGAVRIQTKPDADGMDVTMAIPLTGAVKLAPAGGRGADKARKGVDLNVAGIATARLRLARLGENLWRPAGIGVLASVSDDEPPFHITRLTVAGEGIATWTVTDPTAITALDQLPNIPAGTKLTVTVTVVGDTADALPFIVANGKLMHMQPAASDVALAEEDPSGDKARTFARSFTLQPFSITKDKLTLSKDAGMIGVKVLNTAAMTKSPKSGIKVEATGWAVCFPSQDSGKARGFAELENAGRLNRHVQAILQLISAHENQPKPLIADQPAPEPVAEH